MLKTVLVTVALGAGVLAAGAAHAGTHWSVGISVPVAGVYVSDAPRYVAPAPVYYAPPPPVVYAPRYVEREVVYVPAPRVVYEPRHHHHHHWRDRDDDRYEVRYDDRRWRDGREWRERWDREPVRVEGPYRGR